MPFGTKKPAAVSEKQKKPAISPAGADTAKTPALSGKRTGIIVAAVVLILLIILFAVFLTGDKETAPKEPEYAVSEPEAVDVYEAEPETEAVPETEPIPEEPEKMSTYQYVVKDISWTDAAAEAEASGGHLAVITSEEEYQKICELANESGLTYIWLGARVDAPYEDWRAKGWITGESWSFEYWYPNEPSGIDISDNVEELYLCLWNVKYEGTELGWTFNDQRNDLAGDFPSLSGKIGYIVEYEE